MRSVFLLLATALASAAADIPRPEFPQPQFEREQWLNLNGRWEFEFDDQNAGLDEHWASGARAFARSIVVPFCFESPASGIHDPAFHPWIWYRRSVTLPEAWAGKRVLLHFGAVDYRAMVWVNGALAGAHEGGSVGFQFDITALLKPGANVITVRAEDPPTDRFLPRGKQYWEVQSRGIFYKRTSGIWQTVWLEATGASYLEQVRITPSNDGSVRFAARISRSEPGLEFRARISRDGKLVASGAAANDGTRAVAGAALLQPALWSVNSPNLYQVTFELCRGEVVLDRVKSYFGFRSVGIAEGRVAINNARLYLKFLLDQGYWPQSNLTPPSDEAIQYDIRMSKEMGFNGVRKHQKVEDPRFLYWADKMGFLISGEMANSYAFDEEYAARFTREWMEVVERDYNHPSIIMWAPINESWGVPNLRDRQQQNHLKSLYTLTKTLDATRLVIDNEGWEHTHMTDLFAIHDYARTGDLLVDLYRGWTARNVPTPANRRQLLIPGYKYNGSPVYLSEFGGIAYIPEGHQVPEKSWGYAGVEKSSADALARLRGIYEGIAKLPMFAGVGYTQLTDVEQEINGLMTYDRKMKFDPKAIKELNALLQ
jgi:beta-galactosidase/beta-glucuronidase